MRVAVFCFAILLAVALVANGQTAPAAYDPAIPRCTFTIKLEDWFDVNRGRTVPVKLFRPDLDEPRPVVLISHGLGGSREMGRFVCEAWAAGGYVVVAMPHPGSDTSVWQGVPARQRLDALRKAANGEQYLNRIGDVRFVLDELERRNALAGDELQGRLDLTKIAMSGHSFGAVTTQAVVGVRAGPKALNTRSARDERIDCAIAFSPSVPNRADDLDWTFADVRVPVFHLTGTEDVSPIGETSAKDRLLPFEHITGVDQYRLVFAGGDHMVFAGRVRRLGDASKDDRFHELIKLSTRAFLDAYLMNDESARAWLREQFENVLGNDGEFDIKAK